MPLSPVVARFALFYGRRSSNPPFLPSADQVSEVERLPRSGGLSGHLIHAGMPNDFLFLTRKGNGIEQTMYNKKRLLNEEWRLGSQK